MARKSAKRHNREKQMTAHAGASRNGDVSRAQINIAKTIKLARIFSKMNLLPQLQKSVWAYQAHIYEVLEPCARKPARTVLRGKGARKGS